MPERCRYSHGRTRSGAGPRRPKQDNAGAGHSGSAFRFAAATDRSSRASCRRARFRWPIFHIAPRSVRILATARQGEARWVMKLSDPKLFRQQCYIDGEWVDALNRGTIPVTDPASGETLGTVPRMGAEETRRAIEAANKALPAWRAKTAKERAQILRRWYDFMMANQEDLATLMTAEQGKPLAEARGEIAYAAA